MDFDDPHAPLDPTASGSGGPALVPPAAEPTGPASRPKVLSNADFYASHFESHVASVAAHFRGETDQKPGPGPAKRRRLGPLTFPSAHFAWSEADTNLFYASLRRRSKSWPELIAADMAGRKSLVEVTAYLARLDGALGALPDERRKQLRVPPLPAREVSERWVEFEEEMASDYLDRSRKRERAEDAGALQVKRDELFKQAKRALPPPPWTLPGAGPKTWKQQRRRDAQLKATRQELEKEFAREDWLRLLDQAKSEAISKEIKHPSRLGVVQPGASDDDSDDGQDQPAAAQPVQPVETPSQEPPPAVVTFEDDTRSDRASSTGAKKKSARIPFHGGRLRREVVVMRLGDMLHDKGLDVLSFKVAHRTLSYNPSPGSEPIQIPLPILQDGVALLRAHVTRVLQRTLALKSPDHDSELERSSASDSRASSSSRLITGKLVREAIESLQGAEDDHWVDDFSPTLVSSAEAAPDLSTPDLRASPETQVVPEINGSGDDEEPPPIVSVASEPGRVRFEAGLPPPTEPLRPLGAPTIYRPHARLAKDQPYPAGVTFVPFDPELLKPATFFTDNGPTDALVHVSDDEIEADRVKTEDDEADVLQDRADLAADRAWEDGLWSTIRAMDPDGLAWLTLGSLIDSENTQPASASVLSEDDDDDDEHGSDDGMSDGAT